MKVKILKDSIFFKIGDVIEVYDSARDWPIERLQDDETDDYFYLSVKDKRLILKLHCEVVEINGIPTREVNRKSRPDDSLPYIVYALHKDWPADGKGDHNDPNDWYRVVDSDKFLSKHHYGPLGQDDVGYDPKRPIYYLPTAVYTAIRDQVRLPNGEGLQYDPVNRPAHYTEGKIEVIDFIEDKNLNFRLGNAVKYIARAGKKDPAKYVEDLRKAAFYLNREIEKHGK